MFETLRNLTSYRIARSSRRKGPMGTLARLGISRSVGTGRGLSGTLARTQRTWQGSKLGIGAVIGTALVVAGIAAARRAMSQPSHHEHAGARGK